MCNTNLSKLYFFVRSSAAESFDGLKLKKNTVYKGFFFLKYILFRKKIHIICHQV